MVDEQLVWIMCPYHVMGEGTICDKGHLSRYQLSPNYVPLAKLCPGTYCMSWHPDGYCIRLKART